MYLFNFIVYSLNNLYQDGILLFITPQLAINFSNIKCSYCGIPKIVLAHKMHGFPYPDLDGMFGISNRDNYVILKENKPLKVLARDTLVVYLSVILGNFVMSQVGGIDISKSVPQVFTNTPDF